MIRVGLLSMIFPEIEACRRTAVRYYGKGGVLKHSFETVENLEWLLDQIRCCGRAAGHGRVCRCGGAAVTAESAVMAALSGLARSVVILASPG